MAVILKDTVPTILEVAELGCAAVRFIACFISLHIKINATTNEIVYSVWIVAELLIGRTKA